MSIIAFTTRNRNRNHQQILSCRTVTGFLRKVTCRLVYGRKKPNGPRPVLPIDPCVDNYNRKGYGEQWSVWEFNQHQEGRETLYYFGSDDTRNRYTLVNIDIDIQKSKGLGSPEGAKALAEHYKKLFPGAYFETSTGGKSQHGYLLVEKEGYVTSAFAPGLKRLEAYLQEQAKGFDVEKVEVMGTPPQVRWAGRKIDGMSYGKFAKLPRHATLDDLQRLHVIPIHDLLRGDKYKVELSAPVISPKAGSVSFDFIDEDRLSRLEAFVQTFISGRVDAKKGYANVHDFAVTLAILMFTKRNPSKYKDGSQPTARIRKLWACLVDQGSPRGRSTPSASPPSGTSCPSWG